MTSIANLNTAPAPQPFVIYPVYPTVADLLASSEPPRGSAATWLAQTPSGTAEFREAVAGANGHHLVTKGGVPLNVMPVGGIFNADGFGALGDGQTDDTTAIQRALDCIPDHATLRFSSGATYLVSSEIASTQERSLTVLAHGATFKCADDSVWHVFKLGGPSADQTECVVRWYGGTFDGNLANQRYYPNTDGTTIFTDLGSERAANFSGTPFYENSPVNGTTWDSGWINGQSNDGVNVNGGGNNGLIRVQHAKLAVFEDIECRNFVRNGLVTWNTAEVHATRIRGIGQLPTTYFELVSLFDLGHEAALMKFTGASENSIVGGTYSERVTVSDCYSEGGAMPLFVRNNPPKSPSSGTVAKVRGCQFYGIAREMWFEVCQSVTISGCDITCSDYPHSTYRRDPAIFIGSGTQDWIIDSCYIYGRINTNAPQAMRTGSFVNSTLIDYSEQDQRSLQCELVADSYVESRSGGILADRIRGSRLYLEDRPGSETFKVRTSLVDTVIGREWFEGTRERKQIAAGKSSTRLSGAPDVIQRVLFRSRDAHKGRWFEAHESDYRIDGDSIHIQSGNEVFSASTGPVDVEVDWYALNVDTFRTDMANADGFFVLTRPGGCRTRDITSVTYNASPLLHRNETGDVMTEPHWQATMTETGHMAVELVNCDAILVEAGELVIRYRPPLAPYRALSATSGETEINAKGVNFEGIICEGGHNIIRGSYRDISGPSFVRFKDGTDVVDLTDLTVERLNGGVLCGINASATCHNGYVRRAHIRDWMMRGARLAKTGDTLNTKAFGALRKNGTQFLSRMMFTDTVMEHTGIECGASQEVGNNQSGVLRNGYAMIGGNLYLGVGKPFKAGVGDNSVLMSKPDLAI